MCDWCRWLLPPGELSFVKSKVSDSADIVTNLLSSLQRKSTGT